MTAARICAAEGCGRRLTGKGDLCRSHHGAALGAANRGRKHDPDVRARMSEARKKALADPDVRARISEASKKAWADPDVRARMSEARKKAWADPDVRARISEARKKAWADPEKNPLAALTETERADYDCVKRAMRYTRAEALRAIGRADLAEAAQ
mgnify:CR=1 FL=1